MNAAERSLQEAEENRLRVWQFFRANPCHTKRECADVTGLTVKTVGRHARAIRDGWRPDPLRVLASVITISDDGESIVIGRAPHQIFAQPSELLTAQNHLTQVEAIKEKILRGVLDHV